jgi:hypothetical protein
MHGLLSQLCSLDHHLNRLLLSLALLDVPPPLRSLVFTRQSEVLACAAARLAFVALLSAESAGEATY